MQSPCGASERQGSTRFVRPNDEIPLLVPGEDIPAPEERLVNGVVHDDAHIHVAGAMQDEAAICVIDPGQETVASLIGA